MQKNGILRKSQDFENGAYSIKETDLALEIIIITTIIMTIRLFGLSIKVI